MRRIMVFLVVITMVIAMIPAVAFADAVFTLEVNNGVALNGQDRVQITTSKLSAPSTTGDNTQVVFEVYNSTDYGRLEHADNPNVAITSFTQQALMDGKIWYVVTDTGHQGVDEFEFTLSQDGTRKVFTARDDSSYDVQYRFTLVFGQRTLLVQESFEGDDSGFITNSFANNIGDYSTRYSADPLGRLDNMIPHDGSDMWLFEDVDNYSMNPLGGAFICLDSEDVSAYEAVMVSISLGADKSADFEGPNDGAYLDGTLNEIKNLLEYTEGFFVQYAMDSDILATNASNVNTGNYATIGAFNAAMRTKGRHIWRRTEDLR